MAMSRTVSPNFLAGLHAERPRHLPTSMQSTADARRDDDNNIRPSSVQLASINSDLHSATGLDAASPSIDVTDRALLHRLLRLARLLEAGENAGALLGPSAISQTRRQGSASANPTISSDPLHHLAEHAFQPSGSAYSPARTDFDYYDDDDIYDTSSNEVDPEYNQTLQATPSTAIDPNTPIDFPNYASSSAWRGRDQHTSDVRSTEPNVAAVGRDSTQSLSAKARPHAIVEQRYRQSMNEKLRLLHAAIPASGRFSAEALSGPQVDRADNITQQSCKSKSAVLANAVSYIESLLESHRRLDEDSREMQDHIQRWLSEFKEDNESDGIRDSAGTPNSSHKPRQYT